MFLAALRLRQVGFGFGKKLNLRRRNGQCFSTSFIPPPRSLWRSEQEEKEAERERLGGAAGNI